MTSVDNRITRSTLGQTMAVILVLCWTAQMTSGQEIVLKHYDNLPPSEIRLDARAIRWMDFNKPDRPPQQVRPQSTYGVVTGLAGPTTYSHGPGRLSFFLYTLFGFIFWTLLEARHNHNERTRHFLIQQRLILILSQSKLLCLSSR